MERLRNILALLFLSAFGAMGQNPNSVEMADTFRESGKIYVVVAVVVIIFAGLFVYLISLDKKVSRLEKKLKK